MNDITLSMGPGRILKVFLFGLLIIPSLLMSQEQIEKKGSDPLQNAIRTDSVEVEQLLEKSEDLRNINPDSSMIMPSRLWSWRTASNINVAKPIGFKWIGADY